MPLTSIRKVLLVLLLLLISAAAFAQTHTEVTVEDNQSITGVKTFVPGIILGPVFFVTLPPVTNGAQLYCADCNPTQPCTAGGTGAMAFGLNGIWACTNGAGGGGGGGTPGGLNTQIQYNQAGSFGGLTNSPPGSALVSKGVSSTPGFQTKPTYDVRDYGVVLDGVTDNTAAYSTLLGNIGTAQATILVSGPMALEAVATPSNVTLQFVQSGAIVIIANTTPPGLGSFVQVSTPTTNGNPYTNSCTTTFPSPITTGNTIAVFTEHFFTGSTDQPPTDNLNNFYRIGTLQSFNFPSLLSNWYASNVHGGSTTVTFALAGTVENQCVAIEIAGLGPSVNVTSGQVGIEFLGHPSTTMSSGGSAGSQPQITFPNGTFIIANGGQSFIDSRACTPQSGFTLTATTGGSSNQNPALGGGGDSMCVEYQASSSAITENVTMGITTDPLVTTSPIRGWFMTATGLIAGPATINIAGPIVAPLRQIFFNATGSLGSVDLTGNQSITTVYPEWWGACGSCSASINTPAIQAAINAAYGTARINGSGLNQYDRELHFSALYSVNGTLNANHMNGFNWTCEQRFACGLQQTATNTSILQTTCGGTYGAFHKMLWSTNTTQNLSSPLVDLNYTCAPSSDLVTQFIDFYENEWGGNGQAQVGLRIAGAGGGAQGSNIDFYDNGWVSFGEAGVLIGNTSGGYGGPGNTQGGVNCNTLATNALAINFYNGDIQGSPTWGIENCGGGFIMVDGMSFENGFGDQIGCDLGLRSGSAGDRFVVRGVRSESLCVATGAGDWGIYETANVDQSFFPNPGQTPGGVGGHYTIITPSAANPQNGAYYKFTAVTGPYSGLGNPTTPLIAASGTTNTLTDSVGGLTPGQWNDGTGNHWILSILSGTGALTYCPVLSNTATTFTCSTSAFKTIYTGVTPTSPDNTSHYVVEPDYTKMTLNGGVTFGPVAQVPVLGNLTSHNFFVPGLQLNIGPVIHGDIQVSRSDWFYNQLTVTIFGSSVRPLDMQVLVGQLNPGGADLGGGPAKLWSLSDQQGPRPSRGYIIEEGTGTLMWGAGAGGPKSLDAGIEPDPATLSTIGGGCMRLYNDSSGASNPIFYAWRWCYDGSWWNPGNVVWTTDNTNTIGTVGANRPSKVFVGTDFVGPIGQTTPAAGSFTTISASGQITSTLTTGTAPFVIASTTNVPNLNASTLGGATFASPGPIGSTTPSTGAFSSLTVTGLATLGSGATESIATGTASNVDLGGELSFSGVTTGSYSFTGTYTTHPECFVEPQFDPGAGNYHWVTYTGVASFTINWHANVTGNVSYACIGRN